MEECRAGKEERRGKYHVFRFLRIECDETLVGLVFVRFDEAHFKVGIRGARVMM
jgi:hypothetical protein